MALFVAAALSLPGAVRAQSPGAEERAAEAAAHEEAEEAGAPQESAEPAADGAAPEAAADEDAAAPEQPAEVPAPDDPAVLAAVVPPEPLGEIVVPYPEAAPPIDEALIVEATLQIDESGAVTDVTIVRGAGSPWDETVVEAARRFRFRPATYDGQPVAVEIPFVQRFLPRAAREPLPDEGPVLDAAIEGAVVEKGTRRPVPSVEVQAKIGDRTYRAEADRGGAFSLAVPAGDAEVEVVAPGYRRFVVRERLLPNERARVRYLVERLSYDPYEVVVIGKAEREEVARTTLREREIKRIPGTFGDPFRVIGTLPGVSQVMSLVSYPIVRGSTPGSTGILLDGVRIPQLYHFLGLSSTVHPEFIERVDFYPGSFPLEYGGYTGGIVDGITRRARPDERRVDVGINLLDTSLLVRQPLGGNVTGTVAGRYGYPAMLLSLFSEDAYASYWDYQGRLDGGDGRAKWTAFAFGAHDSFGSSRDAEAGMTSEFHRLDLRLQLGDERRYDRYAITFGVDRLLSGEVSEDDEDAEVKTGTSGATTITVQPRLQWKRPLTSELSLRMGLEAMWRESSLTVAEVGDQDLGPEAQTISAGAFLDTPWWLTRDLVLVPGARLDVWQNSVARQGSFDPRLGWRYRVDERENSELWLKGGVGMYHQPPRLPIPIPGFGEISVQEGLPAAAQTSLGAELELASGYHFDVTTYYNHMDPVYLDLEVNERPDGPDGEEAIYDAFRGKLGRSYGVEVILRRREHGNLFGWISYTLSRSERREDGDWVLFDFDRTHMLHVVAGLRLARDWELGGRFQFQTGRPVSAIGEPVRRSDPFTRFDLRIDRRAVYAGWMLDFYIDVMNVMYAPEAVGSGPDGSIRYVLPTVGFRGVF